MNILVDLFLLSAVLFTGVTPIIYIGVTYFLYKLRSKINIIFSLLTYVMLFFIHKFIGFINLSVLFVILISLFFVGSMDFKIKISLFDNRKLSDFYNNYMFTYLNRINEYLVYPVNCLGNILNSCGLSVITEKIKIFDSIVNKIVPDICNNILRLSDLVGYMKYIDISQMGSIINIGNNNILEEEDKNLKIEPIKELSELQKMIEENNSNDEVKENIQDIDIFKKKQ